MTTSSARLDWAEICANPADFEKLVKLLLQRQHPHGQAIDGAGGDEGREFEVRTADRLELWEAKSFTGRVSRRNPNRRRQVEDSLKSAARHQPDAWHLVVPIDPNPVELAWFESLHRGDYPFVDQWCGRTWLETQFALPGNTDLVRYATLHTLLEYVRQYKLETESLVDGQSTLLQRVQALDELADEVNPHWKPTFGRMPDGTLYTTVQAKHPDAATEAPISFTVSIDVPAAAEHDELREAVRTGFELGTGASVPGEFVTEFSVTGPPGLGLPASGKPPDLVQFVAIPDADPADLPTQTLAVYEPDATVPLATLVFHPATRTVGTAGARITAYDASRAVELVTDVRRDTIHLSLHSQDVRPITPAALLPSLRLAVAMRPPNRVVLSISKDGARFDEDSLIEQPFLLDPPNEAVVRFIEDLAAVQDALHQPFPVPDRFSREEAHNANRVRRLIAGERVAWNRGPITVTVIPGHVEEFRAQFADASSGRGLRISYDDVEFGFGEHTLHAGPMYFQAEALIDLEAITLPDDGSAPTATFELLGDGWLYAQHGVPADLDATGPERAPQSGRFETSATPLPDDQA